VHDKILILDFGSQVTQLIARRIRDLKVLSEIFPYDISAQDLEQKVQREGYKGIILSGGPSSVTEVDSPRAPDNVFTLGIPILGICYGMQTMATQLGGQVQSAESLGHVREFGYAEVRARGHTKLLENISDFTTDEGHGILKVWMSHGDSVTQAPAGFASTAHTVDTPIAAFESADGKFAGVQFHPEVLHSEYGQEILCRWLIESVGCAPTWNSENIVAGEVARIKEIVGGKRVLCGLSGGVDSAVAAAIVQKAIGNQLTCVFVDHGLLREGEAEQVERDFVASTGVVLKVVDAKERFLNALAGVTDPETKRKIIGTEFIRVFEAAAREISSDEPIDFLVQGTLYPDVVESGGGTGTANIKSHHNVGGLPDDLAFALIEPLRTLFKDEVREAGMQLGLPREIVMRQPFPGPGLAIRIVGEVTEENLRILRKADSIARAELSAAGLDNDIWQCPVVLLAGVRSVGVQGDGRTYGHPIVLRPVSSEDAMTADWSRVPYDVLEKISTRITNEVREVNRVVLDVTSKPPGTIEWE